MVQRIARRERHRDELGNTGVVVEGRFDIRRREPFKQVGNPWHGQQSQTDSGHQPRQPIGLSRRATPADLTEGTTLEKYYQDHLEFFREFVRQYEGAEFEVISTTMVRQGEALPGVEVVCVLRSKEEPELNVKRRALYMVRGQQGFYVCGDSLLDTWESYAPIFDRAIKSFTLSPTAPPPPAP